MCDLIPSVVVMTFPTSKQKVFDGLFAHIHRRKDQINGLGVYRQRFRPRISVHRLVDPEPQKKSQIKRKDVPVHPPSVIPD